MRNRATYKVPKELNTITRLHTAGIMLREQNEVPRPCTPWRIGSTFHGITLGCDRAHNGITDLAD